MSQSGAPLAGVRVLDLTRLPPGAFCTLLLADLGADVVRVESPHGRPYEGPIGLHRGKRSVAVDLRQRRGGELLRLLAGQVDVLVENERPGAMDERGFGYSHAAVEFPDLIWCSISGYGQEGPYATWSGHDLSYTGHSGLLAAMRPDLPWHPQLIVSIPVGALMSTVAILAALRTPAGSRRGCQLDISLSESASWLLSSSDGILNGGSVGIPDGPDRHVYECADDSWIVVTSAEPKTWDALCSALGLDDLRDSLHRWVDPAEVTERLAAVFRQRRARDWAAELGPLGASVVPVNRGYELAEDPQVRHRGSVFEVAGQLVPRSPIRIRDLESELPGPSTAGPPKLGADTEQVLLSAGLSFETISQLEMDGVVSRAV